MVYMVPIRRQRAAETLRGGRTLAAATVKPVAFVPTRPLSKSVELRRKLDSLSLETFKIMIRNLIALLLGSWGLITLSGRCWALDSVTLKVSPLPKSFVDSHKSDFTVAYPLHLVSMRNLHEDMNPIYQSDRHSPLASSLTTDSKGRETLSSALSQGFMGALDAGKYQLMHHLARLTAYWVGEDYYTSHHMSSTGIHLHGGHCAVDPSVIPYGSVVQIPGVGQFLAVDTGSAVVARTAARKEAHSIAERGALVVDLFFEDRTQGEHFAASGPAYAPINWFTPTTAARDVKAARSLYAEQETGRQPL